MTESQRGYAMAALLVGMSVMSILLSVALPVWRTAAQREREAELIFRGEQYAHAIELYSRRNGGYPPSLDVLEKGRFIRRLYKDPIAGNVDFQPVYLGQIIGGQPVVPRQRPGAASVGEEAGQPPGQPLGQPLGRPLGQPLGQTEGQAGAVGGGPIIGVVSRSSQVSLRLYNGRGRYNEWAFVATELSQQADAPTGGAAGQQGPVAPGRGGQRGGQPGPQRGVGNGGAQPPRSGPPIRGPFGVGGVPQRR